MNKTTEKTIEKKGISNKVDEICLNVTFIVCASYFILTILKAMLPLVPEVWALVVR